jgi:hypothetical protein
VSAACAWTGAVETVIPPQVRMQNTPKYIAIL